MTATEQFDLFAPPTDGPRGGETFDEHIDLDRLNQQMRRVWAAMRDNQWRALHEIATTTGDPEASVSARLRDLRKPKLGRFTVNRRRRTDGGGLFEYQVIAP